MDVEKIYLSMLGELTEPVPGVQNAFAPGQPCAKRKQSIHCPCSLTHHCIRVSKIILRRHFLIEQKNHRTFIIENADIARREVQLAAQLQIFIRALIPPAVFQMEIFHIKQIQIQPCDCI